MIEYLLAILVLISEHTAVKNKGGSLNKPLVMCNVLHWKLLAGTPHSNTPVHKPASREPLWAKPVGHIELILYKMRVSCLRTNSAIYDIYYCNMCFS